MEWQCSYCKRVNDFNHKTCDGCGAGKELSAQQYPIDRFGIPLYVTTSGNGMDAWRALQRGDRQYSAVIQ